MRNALLMIWIATACSSPGASTSDGSMPPPRRDGGRPMDPQPLDPNAAVVPNIDSAVLRVEAVEGARDYRAYAMVDGVEVSIDGDGREQVNGATIFCAGQRQ